MKLPNAVIVHGLEQARTALAVGVPVTLLSAPGAAVYAGAAWWRALVAAAAAGRDMPPDILDCGAAPGRALQALRCGQRRLILRARPDVFPIWLTVPSRWEPCCWVSHHKPSTSQCTARRGVWRNGCGHRAQRTGAEPKGGCRK